MIAAAVRHAQGNGPPPVELELMAYISRFGAQAVLGRMLTRREAHRLVYLEQVVQAVRLFDQAQRSGTLDQLAAQYPQQFEQAQRALLAAYG